MPLSPFVGFDAGRGAPDGNALAGAPSPLAYAAPQSVRDVITALGRTEDLRLAPGGRRLAIASAARNKIILVGVDISLAGAAPQIALTHAVEISSPGLSYPHGLEFLDDDTLVVANRRGGVALFDISAIAATSGAVDLAPIRTLSSTAAAPLQRPGSIALGGSDGARSELLVCNNSGHNITRHVLDRDTGYAPNSEDVLLEKWLDIPDGIAASRDRRWIAVSNHNGYCVMLYENRPDLDRHADPDGLLRGLHAPHGLRFSPDGRLLFVADAGAPYVHVYASDTAAWGGLRYPSASIRVIDEESFSRGRYNVREGGPKGIDLDRDTRILVLTCEWQALAFFDLHPLLVDGGGMRGAGSDDGAILRHEIDALGPVIDMHRRLRSAEKQASQATANERKVVRRLDAVTASTSWRVTAPLRWLRAAFRRRG